MLILIQNSRRTPAPSGLRTPSPTKSRLPIGSSLPQRSASVKGLTNISLQPTIQKSSLRAPGTARKSTISQSILQLESKRVENQHPIRLEKAKVDSSVSTSSRYRQSDIRQKATISAIKETISDPIQPLAYSRAALDDRLELLHLWTIHNQASEAQAQWESHAFQVYQKRFQALQNHNQELNQLEIDQLTQRNASTIISWPKPGGYLSKQIQTLSKVICEVDQLTSIDGRYSLAIQAFEHWIATAVAQQGQQGGAPMKAKPNKVEGLGDGWLTEAEALQWQVVTLADQMLTLGVVEPNGSSLEIAVTTVSEMLKNMLEELEMVMDLESTLKQEGEDRTDGSVATLTEELDRGLRLE